MFFANAMNSVTRPSLPKSKSQQTVVFDVFKDHWRQVLAIFNKSLVNDDDIQIVKSNLAQMVALLVDELNQVTNAVLVGKVATGEEKFSGPLWDYLLATNIFETVYLWSLSYPEYLYDLKYEQLRNYEELISQMQTNEQTNLLLYRQLHRPLFSLLNHCSSHNSELIERYMISILNQLCVCMCKNSSLLNIFFDYSANSSGSMPQSSSSMFVNEASSELILERSTNEKLARTGHAHSKSFIFTLLIPYIHKEGSLGANCGSLTFGQQARDALLMIMQLSSRNQNLAKFIVYSTDFCPILATGLSGLYSELPQKLTQHENFEEIRYLQKEDIIRIHSLNKFINSLEFCNNVIQVSHSLIANQLLQYVYYGFLVPVIAPALTQDVVDKFPVELVQLENYTNCMDEIVSATLYLDLFLRTINEPNLLRVFLKFILFSKFDERMTLLDTLINRINSSTKLSLATLMLFHTMIDLNSEDVIYKLILTYIIPCKHLMKSQLVTLKQSSCEINGLNAQAFLSLSTNFITNSDSNSKHGQQQHQQTENNEPNHTLAISNYSSLNESSPVYRWLNTFMETSELDSTLAYLEGIRFNYVDYLKDAKKGISNTADKTSKWSSHYDVSEKNSAAAANRRSTTTTTASSSSSKSPSGVALTPNSHAVNQPSHELEADVEEFFFNLNVSLATNVISETKSVRSTINLGREHSINDTDSFVDYDVNSITSEKTAGKRSTTTTTTTATATTVTRRRRNSPSRKTATPGQRRRKNKRDINDSAPNDFYILSFDNEISESEDEDDDVDDEELHLEDEDNEDDIESVSSIASSKCSSVDTTTVNNNSDETDRQNLIDYLFSNEENNRLYLNSNLNNFLSGLENYFSDKPINICDTKSSSKKKKKNNQLDSVCEEISKLYSDLIISTTPNNSQPQQPEQKEETHSSMTQFPSYDHQNEEEEETAIEEENNHTQEMTSSSTNSMSQPTADSGVEVATLWSYSQSATSDDLVVAVGPFLCAILNRLEHLLSNSLQINFLVTGIFARLAFYPQLLLRSFLLNNSLVLQPNVKSLIQVLGNVKYKIDACSRTYNNFSLLYLRAKVNLVKRLADNNSIRVKNTSLKSSPSSTFSNQTQSQTTPPTSKKKLIVDRILSIFKPESKENGPSMSQPNQKPTNSVTLSDISTPTVELDLDEAKMKYIKQATNNDSMNSLQQEVNTNDFLMADSEWEDVRTRNIALNAVIFDEFVKELAAICQEHSVLAFDSL